MVKIAKHNPLYGAFWMLTAGVAFATINSLTQILSIQVGLLSTSIAFYQYLFALVLFLPWIIRQGLFKSLTTKNLFRHIVRVTLAVIGIQLWVWALAYPVPIWQGIALLMTSPLIATLGAGILLKEHIGLARILATIAGFSGAMLILEPWSETFTWAALLPLGAAFFWACYSLMVKKLSHVDSSSTMVIYLFLFMTPFNAILAINQFQVPNDIYTWSLLTALGLLTTLAQWAIARAYAVADAAYVQPWDHVKLPVNVLAGYLVFGWVPPGQLWIGAAIIILAVCFITHWENRLQTMPA